MTLCSFHVLGGGVPPSFTVMYVCKEFDPCCFLILTMCILALPSPSVFKLQREAEKTSPVSLGKMQETNISLPFSVGRVLVNAPDHWLRPRWPRTHSHLCFGILSSTVTAHTCSRGKAEEPQGTPQTTTTSSTQRATPSCRWLKQKFPLLMKTLSHMCSIVYEFQEYLPCNTGPGTSDFSFCKLDGELPVHNLDVASKGVVILKP